jgi:uncharacterized protein (DUF58 family)
MTTLGGRWSWPAFVCIMALVAGTVSGWLLLQHIGLTLGGILLVSWLATSLSAGALSAQGRSTSRTVMAGDRLTVRYVLRNRSFWPLPWTLLEPDGFSTLPVQGQFVALGPRTAREIDVSLSCPLRGHWQAGGWTIRTGDPFGLFERARKGSGSNTVIVYPRPIPLPDLVLPGAIGQVSSRRGMPNPHPSATIREVRPYQPGDSPSRIHWLSTARLDALMVKEPEGEPAAHAWLILDLQSSVQYGEDAGDSAELVVGAACEVLQRLRDMRLATGMLIVGPGTLIYPDDRRDHHEQLLATLACTMPGPHDAQQDLRLLQTRAGQVMSTRQGIVIVVTPWADARWTGSLPRLARMRNNVLCIVLDTPDSGRAEALTAQTAVLHTAGVRVYRHTDWAP